MWFECEQPFVGEEHRDKTKTAGNERCVTKQERLRGRLPSNVHQINKPPGGGGGLIEDLR